MGPVHCDLPLEIRYHPVVPAGFPDSTHSHVPLCAGKGVFLGAPSVTAGVKLDHDAGRSTQHFQNSPEHFSISRGSLLWWVFSRLAPLVCRGWGIRSRSFSSDLYCRMGVEALWALSTLLFVGKTKLASLQLLGFTDKGLAC